jgi:hypothetical protein
VLGRRFSELVADKLTRNRTVPVEKRYISQLSDTIRLLSVRPVISIYSSKELSTLRISTAADKSSPISKFNLSNGLQILELHHSFARLDSNVLLSKLTNDDRHQRWPSERRTTMTVIFVLMIFAVFISIDYLQNRGKAPQIAMEDAPVAVVPVPLGALVEGFHVPERLRFHTGHGWAVRERSRLARVGVDEFGAALLGGVDRIELPKPGHWLRQGQKAWTFYRNGEKTEMVSPP